MWKILALSLACIATGCGTGKHDDHAGEEHHGHGDDAQSFSGATHKEGFGITLLPETKEQLGIQTTDVEEGTLPLENSFTVKVFRKNGEEWLLAAGSLPINKAKSLKPGDPIKLTAGNGDVIHGVIEAVADGTRLTDAEVILRVPASSVAPGQFLAARTTVASSEPVVTIPRGALIEGVSGSFVYVENGNAYLRTEVEPGRQAGERVEIKDGLLEGDRVVTGGAMDLWLIELRAVKGGQGCCPAPPAKGKRN